MLLVRLPSVAFANHVVFVVNGPTSTAVVARLVWILIAPLKKFTAVIGLVPGVTVALRDTGHTLFHGS